jgi:elongation factor G
MKNYETSDIRNIVLVGAAKSGKTILTESMMFEGGVTNRMGSIEDHNTVSDYHEVEHERGNSVFSSVLYTEWRGQKINIIDTPGFDDFAGEMVSALRVADTALLVVNAQNGPEVGTEIAWRYLKRYEKPTVLVVNQVDHSKAEFNKAVDKCRQQFGDEIVVVQYPYNPGEGFNSIIDVLKMVMYKFPPEGGKPEKLPIPAEEKERAEELHNTLVEAAAENDETLMELYFEKGALDEDEMRKGLTIGLSHRTIFPLFCLSAKHNMGSGRLMGFLGNVAPAPGELKPEKTRDGEEITIHDPETTLFVFKASNEKHTGSMSFFKVCSGAAVPGMDLINISNHGKGRLSQLFVVNGKNRTSVDRLNAGDIGATVKLKDTYVNNTLRTKDDEMEVDHIEFPLPKIRSAIVAERQGDEEKMAQALNRIHETDPTLIVEFSSELKQVIIHGQGALHLQMIQWALEHLHNVKIDFIPPKIPYRETIQKSAEASYRHKKQTGGAGQFGEVYMKIEPFYEGMADPEGFNIRDTQVVELPWGGKLVFYNCIVGGVIDNRFLPAILKGVMSRMENGPLTGSYARDICVLVYDGKMHAVDSNEAAFKTAGAMAFKDAFKKANPKIMEPIYRVEVLTPDEYTGDVMTDLTGRRAIVEGIDSDGNYQKIIARVPLAEMNRYATSLSSVTQGRATFTRTFIEYTQVPGDVQERLIKEHTEEETDS